MSQFYEYNWEAISLLSELAPAQNVVLNQSLDLSTTKYWDSSAQQSSIIKYGSIRKITLSTTANLSVVNFKVVGTHNGIVVTEIIAGPNNNTISTINFFDTISEITPITGVVPGGARISASLSLTGYFPIILMNHPRNTGYQPWAISFVAAANPATYTTYLSLNNYIGKGKYADLITNNSFFQKAPANNTTTQLIQQVDCAVNLICAVITNNTATTTLKFQFFQPSI